MASSPRKTEISSEKLSNDFLTCPLCYELYKTPKVLLCQHTFCLSCLTQYTRTRGFSLTLPCPLCKDISRIPNGDVSKLKNNYTIVNLLQCVQESWTVPDDEKPSSSSESPSTSASVSAGVGNCGACSESKPLEHFCHDCRIWLCATCTASHRRVPATTQHKLMPINEMNMICKNMACEGELAVQTMKQVNEDKTEIILGQIEQLSDLINVTRQNITAAGDDACHIIREKQSKLLNNLSSFEQKQHSNLTSKLQILDSQNSELSQISKNLDSIKISSDGFENHSKATVVERDLKNIQPLLDFPSSISDYLCMSFIPSRAGSNTIKHLDLGHLHLVKGSPSKPIFLHDRGLKFHKGEMLNERTNITGCAINKFAEKYVVTNNEHVYLFSPNSRKADILASFGPKRVWGVAYCEISRRIFMTVFGDEEGQGLVWAFSLGGRTGSALAIGLTMPRGIAVCNNVAYVCDQIDRCVYLIETDSGRIKRIIKKSPDGSYLFNEPMFVAAGGDNSNGLSLIAVSDAYQSVKIFCGNSYSLLYNYIPQLLETELWDVLVLTEGTTVVCDWRNGLHKISRHFDSNGLIAIDGENIVEPSALSSLSNSNVFYVCNGMGEIYSAI